MDVGKNLPPRKNSSQILQSDCIIMSSLVRRPSRKLLGSDQGVENTTMLFLARNTLSLKLRLADILTTLSSEFNKIFFLVPYCKSNHQFPGISFRNKIHGKAKLGNKIAIKSQTKRVKIKGSDSCHPMGRWVQFQFIRYLSNVYGVFV